MTLTEKYVIIVAGGKGLRMGGDLPKQFISLDGWPILMRTIYAFFSNDEKSNIIVVLPEIMIPFWNDLVQKHKFSVPHKVVSGGETRFHSVKNGLSLVPDSPNACVAVHDGVRPFVSGNVIAEAFAEAAKSGSAVPVIESVDSVRQITGDGNKAVDRSSLRLVQTPQVFSAKILHEAYRQPYSDFFTDDASVAEAIGQRISLTKGNRENIKITTPFDIEIAKVLTNSGNWNIDVK